MTSVVRNTENERLEPIGIGPIKIGLLDKEEGAEAQEIPGFIPIIHELLALVGYWQRRATNRRFYSWLDIQSNPGLSPLVEFARHRVAQIAEQIGEDEVNKVLEETLVAMDKEFGDDIAWTTFLEGKPLEHITHLQPQDSEGYRYRAFVYQQLDRSQEALADYDQAINLDPGHIGGLQSRARVLERLGRIREAIEDYSTLIRLRPDEPRYNYHRGRHYDGLGMEREARQDFEQTLELGLDPFD